MQHGDLVQKRYRSFDYVTVNGWHVNKVFAGWILYGPTFRFRFDPVPGVHHYRNTIANGIRHMKTTQERRMSFACAKKYVRCKRNFRNLPEAWDDKWPAIIEERCWKRTKKKRQWMKKGDSFYEKRKYDLD